MYFLVLQYVVLLCRSCSGHAAKLNSQLTQNTTVIFLEENSIDTVSKPNSRSGQDLHRYYYLA